jgi:hypothetical protein
VLTRDPAGKREPNALRCTASSWDALSISRTVLKRWSLENTFEESHAHVDIETPQPWSDLSIEGSTPLLFAPSSLMADEGHQTGGSEQQTAWSHKTSATFHDALAAVRRLIWMPQVNPTSGLDPDVGVLPPSTRDRLLFAACFSLEMDTSPCPCGTPPPMNMSG